MTDKSKWAELLASWGTVCAKVDDFFRRAIKRHPSAFQCAAGCADCCRSGLSVLPVEAIAVLEAQEALDPAERKAIADRAAQGGERCPYLSPSQRCTVYHRRPLVCRSHGLPVRQDQSVSICPLNFTSESPSAEATMNGSLVTASLMIADSLLRQRVQMERDPELRIPLDRLARVGMDALPEQLRAALLQLSC